MARNKNYAALIKAVTNNDLKGVQHLIQTKKIDPNLADGGFAALYHVKSAEMVDLLCRLGARPNISIESGGYYQPIHTAANADVLCALIRNGADINAVGGVKCSTAMHFVNSAAKVKVLMENGGEAILNARDGNGETPLDVSNGSSARASTNWEVYRCLREEYGAKTGRELDAEHTARVAAKKAEAGEKQAGASHGGGMRR